MMQNAQNAQLAANRIPQAQTTSAPETALRELVGRLDTLIGDYNDNAARLDRALDRLRGTPPSTANAQGGKPQEVADGLLPDCEIKIARLGDIMQTQRSMLNELEKLV